MKSQKFRVTSLMIMSSLIDCLRDQASWRICFISLNLRSKTIRPNSLRNRNNLKVILSLIKPKPHKSAKALFLYAPTSPSSTLIPLSKNNSNSANHISTSSWWILHGSYPLLNHQEVLPFSMTVSTISISKKYPSPNFRKMAACLSFGPSMPNMPLQST